jgi:hypothetical protein
MAAEQHQLGALATEVYKVVHEETESFEEEHIGVDLAYLLGAILTGTYCE